ncbi:unnamed protein product [Porites evermanni]|uniref:Uncharacterized protein n=1 Tax=Porites evermanni TaxID=104178 RepID=A0ABN8LKG8_9CNID|nr:unnamed protein product [Porites evermanni]
MFFLVNNVPDTEKAASLLTFIHGKLYSLSNKIVPIMGRHLTPKPIVIAEKYKFHKGNQEEVQSTHDLLAKLQRLAETCELGEDWMKLRDID